MVMSLVYQINGDRIHGCKVIVQKPSINQVADAQLYIPCTYVLRTQTNIYGDVSNVSICEDPMNGFKIII